MHHLQLLVLVVLQIFCSTNADVAAQDDQQAYSVPLNRLRLMPNVVIGTGAVADSNVILNPLVPSNLPWKDYVSPICLSEGRIADPYDCGQYYDCVRGRSGFLIANKQSCFGHAFDATTKSCVSANLAKGCVLGPNSALRSVPVDEPSLQTICKNHDNEFKCLDCKTLIMCVDRKPYIIPCKSGNVCYDNKEQFNGGVCYPDAPLECTCNADDIFRKDYYDSSKFISCEREGDDPVVKSCPKGLVFNEQRRTCGTPIDTSCSEVGTFALKTDCSQYHTCIYTTSGWFQRNFTCPDKNMYNEQTGRCEDPCDWDDGNFVCTEEGRFENQRDCTSFFECIIDPLDSNAFIQTEYVCPEGYEWLPMVNRHHCVAKGSTLGKCEPHKPNVCEIPTEWCPATRETILAPAAGSIIDSPRRPSKGPVRHYEDVQCFSEGRIADPNNCGQFYECVRGSNGKLIANKRSCFGNAFDAITEECVSLREAKGCHLDSREVFRSVTVEEPSLQNICKTNDNEFICMDCKTLIMCVDRKPYIIPCKSGNVCYNDKESFKGGVCYPNAPLECTCSNDDIFRQDYYNPSKFLSCDSKGADPVVQSCPEGLEFNEDRKACGTPIDTSCSEAGTFALKTDCNKYHTCIYTSTGWFQRNFTCADNTMFNEQTGKCEDPCGWYDGNFECKEEGRFPNPLDCTTFFECIQDPSDNKSFFQIEHVCPEGYEWLPMVNRFHCVAKGSTKERCVPQKPSICEIPKEWCPSNTVTPPPPPPPTTTTLSPFALKVKRCNEAGGNMFGEQCLIFSNQASSCDEAKAACSSSGGSLASIADAGVVSDHILNTFGSGETFWIGATGSYSESAGEMHLFMIGLENNPSFGYQTCEETRGYICEKDTSASAVTLPPSTLPPSPPPVPQETPEPAVEVAPTPVEVIPISGQGFIRSCPHGHFQVGSQCFFIPTEGFKTWYGAQESCKEQGGFLAEPNSIPEFHEALSKETSDYGFWLGGSNRKQGRNWYWSSRGAMVGNSNSWYPEELTRAERSEQCLFLMRGMDKPLAARSCDVEHHYFVCERNLH